MVLQAGSALLLLLTAAAYPAAANDLTNITENVFGNYSGIIPAAFGDFNGDRLTDIVVLRVNPPDPINTVTILLAKEQKMSSSASSLDPLFHWGTREENLQCIITKGTITSVVPSDFDGDGGMDLLLTKRYNDELTGIILWGDHDKAGHHGLTCPDDQPSEWVSEFDLESEPVVFDYNYDYIADLLTVTANGTRRAMVFTGNRSLQWTEIDIDSGGNTDELKAEHASAYVDLNNDGMADVLLTTSTGLELYQAVKDPFGLKFHHHVSWPEEAVSRHCEAANCIGQAVFADFDLNGSLDLILPICFDLDCTNSSLYLIPLAELWTAEQWKWQPMTMDIGHMTFYPPKKDDGAAAKTPFHRLAARVGDIDLDGFPDLLMTLLNKTSGLPESHLLLNAPCGAFTTCEPFWRQYQLEPSFMQGTGTAVLATFFDIFEDGRLDVITAEGSNSAGYKMSAFTNTTQDSDAYFVKVIVLSGACYHNCPNKSDTFVPYGTNSGGQVVSYRSQRPGPEMFDSYSSVGAQLPQTAHFALQLPYTIFGLGLAPNFVDYLWVNISQQTHSWPQIIPNSQLYIIPYPRDSPGEWDAKISMIPSKSILLAGLAMIGTCGLTTLIIVLLHVRERRQDHQAKLQENNRFHFDAM